MDEKLKQAIDRYKELEDVLKCFVGSMDVKYFGGQAIYTPNVYKIHEAYQLAKRLLEKR